MSGYQYRLQGKDRLVRIHRIRMVSLLAIAVVAVFFVVAEMVDQGATFKPLFLPIANALQILLFMGLLAMILGMYLRNLELKSATGESPRYLMAKYSMNRARSTSAIAIAFALLLLLPISAQVAADVLSEPPRGFSIPSSGQENITFQSPDALGVSYARTVDVIVSGGNVTVSLVRDGVMLDSISLNATGRTTLRLDAPDINRLTNWTVVLRNTAPRSSAVTVALSRAVMSSFFTVLPFLLILYGAANIGWWIGLRPIRDRSKTAAVYGGGVSTTVEQDERFYVEYAQNPVKDVVPIDAPPPPPPPPAFAPPPPPVPARLAPAEPAKPLAKPMAVSRVDTPESFVEKGSSLYSVGAYEPALVTFDEALRLNPTFMPALRAKASCFLRLEKPSEALDLYKKILTIEPRNDEALRAVATLLISSRRWREALEAVDTVLRSRPNDRTYLELKGDVLTNLGRRAEALGAYEGAFALDPGNENVRQKIEEVRVDVPGLLSRALIASASGNYAAALNLFDDILEVEPSNVNALIGKAVAYRRSGKPSEAINCLDLVLSIQPGNVAAFLNRGHILEEQGDFDGALDTFDKLVSLTPGDEEAWTAQGNVLTKMGRDDDALRAYAEALKLNPGDEEIQARIKELEEARSIQADVLQELYKVKGIGPARAKALVETGYKTAEDFARTTVEQLMAVKGITKKLAQDLVKHFKETLVEAR